MKPPVALWLVPTLAVLLLPFFADPARNQAWFLVLNHGSTFLPDGLWSSITVLGDTLVALVLILLFLRPRPDLALAVLLASLPAFLLTHGLKDALDLARPYAVLGDWVHVIGIPLRSGSFPSGHTTTAFVLAAVLVGGLRSARASFVIVALALLVGYSRIAVGAHWPLDVLGGILCGWGCGLLGLYLARRVEWAGWPAVVPVMRVLLLGCAASLFFHYDSGYTLARPFELGVAVLAAAVHLLPGWRMEKSA